MLGPDSLDRSSTLRIMANLNGNNEAFRTIARATTIHDVAREAGVSVTPVSRALSEPALVRHSTRERVLATAERLSYEPNRAARSLITGRTSLIGIVVPDLC